MNDTFAGDPLPITYCPLTATAMDFRRGDTEFGVSGNLVNTNLIMYDRDTGSWCPQMMATAGLLALQTLLLLSVVALLFPGLRKREGRSRGFEDGLTDSVSQAVSVRIIDGAV